MRAVSRKRRPATSVRKVVRPFAGFAWPTEHDDTPQAFRERYGSSRPDARASRDLEDFDGEPAPSHRSFNPTSTLGNLGPGIGANFRYVRPGTTVVAVEPNPYMHRSLRLAAERHQIELEIRDVVGERIDLPDASADAVISSLVLCSVANPSRVVSEVRRVLRAGGRYSYLEHVATGTFTRRVQHAVGRPWAWVFEGCSCERARRTDIRVAVPSLLPAISQAHRRPAS